MTAYETLKRKLKRQPRAWLVTGAAGFIGSNLVEALLKLNQRVMGLDNFETGGRHNLAEVKSLVTAAQWRHFRFIEGSIVDAKTCQKACRGADYVLHQAALGSVPRSVEDPVHSDTSNVSGFVKMLVAARDHRVRRFVYASSSAIYGDDAGLPKIESRIGHALSPYAVTKYVNELYAEVFARCYGMETAGLRYFNVFGPRQDPDGAYAAVIPRWIASMIQNQTVYINGDGKTSRDFCYVDNVVQMNLLAATTTNPKAANQIFNVALNTRVSLNELFKMLRERLAPHYPHLRNFKPVHQDFRTGDVRHSQADISKAKRLTGYAPTHRIQEGLDASLEWYRAHLS